MAHSRFWGLISNPNHEWIDLRQNPPSLARLYFGQVIWLAALPALFTYLGTTINGWSLPGSTQTVRLTPDSALWMAVLAWLAMVAAVAVMLAALIILLGRSTLARVDGRVADTQEEGAAVLIGDAG